MSLTKKIQAAIGVIVLLTTAGAIGVSAQSPAAVDSSSSNSRSNSTSNSTSRATTTAAPTSEPQKAELAEPSMALDQFKSKPH